MMESDASRVARLRETQREFAEIEAKLRAHAEPGNHQFQSIFRFPPRVGAGGEFRGEEFSLETR